MLHMAIAIHSSETCPGAHPEIREKTLGRLSTMDEAAASLGAKVIGSWTNMPAHETYIVVDAPNAHVVNQFLMDIGIIDWNTTHVNPVVPFGEAASVAAER